MNKQLNPLKDTAKLKQRFADFKVFFNQASAILSATDLSSLKTYCDELLGVFLGIKPLLAGYPSDLISKLDLPEYLYTSEELIYNKEALLNLFENFPKYFKFKTEPNFSKSFWDEFYNGNDFYLLNIRRGLAHGYPYNSVLNYSESFSLTYRIFNAINQSHNSTDKSLFDKYRLAGQSEAFFSAYTNEFIDYFKRNNLDISEDQYSILCSRSTGLVRGIGSFAWVGKTSKEDIEYVSQINKLYQDLKIEDYIQENFFD